MTEKLCSHSIEKTTSVEWSLSPSTHYLLHNDLLIPNIRWNKHSDWRNIIKHLSNSIQYLIRCIKRLITTSKELGYNIQIGGSLYCRRNFCITDNYLKNYLCSDLNMEKMDFTNTRYELRSNIAVTKPCQDLRLWKYPRFITTKRNCDSVVPITK